MTLIDDFFRLVRLEPADGGEGDFRCLVQFNADHAIYQAHFPGQPITPGVCLVQMATEILERHLGLRLRLSRLGSIRFRSPITPQVCPEFAFSRIKWTDDQLSVNVTVQDDTHQYVKMSLLLLSL